MSVKIIVDSASDVTVAYAEQNGLGFAPLKTILAGKEYRDGVDVVPDKFYPMLEANKELARTSQVNVSEFAELFGAAVAAGDDVLVITISSGLSGTCQSARLAAADYEGRVFVLDSLNATAGEQVLISHALKLRDEGKSAAEIYEELVALRLKTRLFVRVDTLEYLKRGGRISKATALIGGVLHIKPLLTLNKEGKLETVGKARGNKMSHKLMNESIAACGGIDPAYPVHITYAGDVKDGAVDAYLKDSVDVLAGITPAVCQLGCVIGTYTGPGAIVISFVAKNA